MGVITDKTGLEIVGKIGDLNVDTSGLVQDTTAQETNNAIDALKGAVQGLGTVLGSDRALIDGSNIGSPSTFRSAINAQEKISSNTATVTLSTSKYGTFYYADTTPTVATSRIISIVITSSGGNNFAQCIITASGVIRVFGDYSGGSVTIKYFYV